MFVKTSVVTGGAGFLGSHLVDALLKRGESVVVLDNLRTGRLANLEKPISTGRVTFIYADVAAEPSVLRGLLREGGVGRVDAIYHLASSASRNAYADYPWETLAVNGLGTMSLIEIALERNARFVLTTGPDVYADPSHALSCYDVGKRFGAAAVAAAVEKRKLNARIVRLFHCYGPRMPSEDGNLIPALMDAVLSRHPMSVPGTGNQTSAMTYVLDAIDGLLTVADYAESSPNPVDVGSGSEKTALEITETLAAVLGVSLPIEYVSGERDDDPSARPLDGTHARNLGWRPSTTLEHGLRLTYDWFATESRMFV